MVARWAKVRNPDGVVRAAVSFPYHPIMVADIKEVPSRLREWIPELKVWLVDPKRWETIMENEAATWTFTRDPALGRVVVEWWKKQAAAAPEAARRPRSDAPPCTCDPRIPSGWDLNCRLHGPQLRERAGGTRKECNCASSSIMCPVHGLAAAYQRSGPRFTGFDEFAEAMRGGRVRFGEFRFDFPPRSSPPPPPVRRGRGPTDDDYRVLGVKPGDPADVVKAAYRRLALKLHPDLGGDEEKLKMVNVARDRIMAALEIGQ